MQPLRLDVMGEVDAREFLIKICPRIEGLADEIARLCGYLPLALRIAASAVAEHPDIEPKQYAQSLLDRRERIAKLKSVSDPALNVQATFELSYELLSPASQRRWRALAVFAGQFHWSDAVQIWASSDVMTQQELRDFGRSSMIDYDAASDRYHLHELLASYADALLRGRERETSKSRHAEHYLSVASYTSHLYLKGGNNILEALWVFDKEWPNIQAAYGWSIEGARSRTKAAKICNEFGYAGLYCMGHRMTAHERIEWYTPALAAARQLKDKFGEANHLGNLGTAYLALGDYQNAIQCFQEALKLERQIRYKEGQGKSLGNLGSALIGSGKIENGIELISQALAIHTEIGNQRSQAKDLGNLGTAYRDLGELPKAFAFHSRALALARATGDKHGEALWLANLGVDLNSVGLQHRALALHEDALTIARHLGDKTIEGIALTEVGLHYFNPNEIRNAIQYFEEALGVVRQAGDKPHEASYLGNLGLAYAGLGDRDKALNLCRQALAVEREIGGEAGDAEGLSRLGRVYYLLGDVADAVAFLEQARAIYNKLGNKRAESKLLGLLGDILSKDRSRMSEAEEMYKKAIQADPTNLWTVVDLVWLFRRQGREREAIPFLEAAANLDPTNPDALLVLASIYRKLGDNAALKNYVERARKLIPPDEWYGLASVESICGNADLAFVYLKRAVEKQGFDRLGAWRNWNLDWIRNDPRFEQIVGPRPNQSSSPPDRANR